MGNPNDDATQTLPCERDSFGDSEWLNLPEASAADWGVGLLLFVASCLYLRLFYNYVGFGFDEGLVLQGAQRILHGQVLYRDFFSFYTPGSYYWMALLFKVFGSSILVGRGALTVYGGLFSVFTFLLARRVCSRSNAVLAALPAAAVGLPGWFLVIHSWDSTLWTLLALYCAVRFMESRHWAWAFGLGSLAAVSCLVEQSKGAGLVLGLGAGFLILALSDRFSLWAGRRLVALALGFALPTLLTLAYFGSHGALVQMRADLMWPFYHYASPSKLPYGDAGAPWAELLHGSFGWRTFIVLLMSPLFIISGLPIFAACGLAYWTFRFRRTRGFGRARRYYVLISAALSGLLLSTLATGRPDATHIMLQAPLFCLVLGWMAEAAKTPFLKAAKTLGVSYALVSLSAFSLSFLAVPLAAGYKIKIRGGIVRTPAPYDALGYIQSRVAPGERILVYPYQPLYYYLAGTYSVSRYERLLAGTYEPSQFQEMARELQASRPRVVLFDPSFTEVIPRICPNVAVEALAAKDPVVDYLFVEYHPCRTFGEPGMPWHVVFMVWKDLSCS